MGINEISRFPVQTTFHFIGHCPQQNTFDCSPRSISWITCPLPYSRLLDTDHRIDFQLQRRTMSTQIAELERAGPIPAPRLPLNSRIRIFIATWVFKALAIVVFGIHHQIRPTSPSQHPTIFKTYLVRPHLTNRVCIPRSYKHDEKLPICIDMHLGGFVMGWPWWDHAFCSHFCNTYNLLLVLLNYSKAPNSPFPVPANDIIALVQAVLSDKSLPIDESRVVIGGISAGGNLALAAAHAPELQGKIHGAVCWCAITEWVAPIETKLKNRPYREAKQVDELYYGAPSFNWSHIKPGQDLRDVESHFYRAT